MAVNGAVGFGVAGALEGGLDCTADGSDVELVE